jgi:hypothetical protein
MLPLDAMVVLAPVLPLPGSPQVVAQTQALVTAYEWVRLSKFCTTFGAHA